jgi:hypothetical protein
MDFLVYRTSFAFDPGHAAHQSSGVFHDFAVTRENHSQFDGFRVTVTNTLYEIPQRTIQQTVDVPESKFHAAKATAPREIHRAIEKASRVAQK